MEDLIAHIAELHVRTAELKRMIVEASGVDGDKLRDGIYQLEAAIYVMERNAADAYRMLTMKAGEG